MVIESYLLEFDENNKATLELPTNTNILSVKYHPDTGGIFAYGLNDDDGGCQPSTFTFTKVGSFRMLDEEIGEGAVYLDTLILPEGKVEHILYAVADALYGGTE